MKIPPEPLTWAEILSRVLLIPVALIGCVLGGFLLGMVVHAFLWGWGLAP